VTHSAAEAAFAALYNCRTRSFTAKIWVFFRLQDVIACKSLPLPGYQVSVVGNTPPSAVPGTSDADTAIFKVSHATQARDVHYFLAENISLMKQCVRLFLKSIFAFVVVH